MSRQNARVRPRRLFHLALLGACVSCGGEEPAATATNHTVEAVRLDVGKTDAAPPTPAAASASRQETAPPVNASAAKSAPRESGSPELDAWHRSPVRARAGDTAAKGAAGALAALGQALAGGAAAYQAQAAQRAPTALGGEHQRLAQAFGSGGTAALEAALAAGLAHGPAFLAWNEVLAVRAFELNETERGGRALGRLLHGMTAAGYPRERILELAPLALRGADGVGGVLPASEHVVAKNDSYWKICSNFKKQGQPVEPGWIKLFNRRKGDTIDVGDKLRIPSAPLRVEAWRQSRLVAVFAGDLPIRIYAASSGRPESPTPLGEFTLKICEKNPVYYPPGAPAIPYANPDNPLGERWLGFAEDRQYGLHGTNSEATIGSFETGGCVRLHNADAVELFDLVGPGAKVRINP